MKRRDIEDAVESFCSRCLGFCFDSSECPDRACPLWEVRTVDLCANHQTLETIHFCIDEFCLGCPTHECSDCYLNLGL